jgi:hypothetical protein
VNYTALEKVEKKYTVAEAKSAAKRIVLDRSNNRLRELCIDSVKNRADDEKITVVELNDLSRNIISDTFFHNKF